MKNLRIARLRKQHHHLIERCIHHRELLTYDFLPELFAHSARINEFLKQQQAHHQTICFTVLTDEQIAGVALFSDINFEERYGQFSSLLLTKDIDLKDAGELLIWMIDYGFNELNLHRIYGYLRTDNTAFVSLVENCGMLREAQLRKSAFYNGAYRNLYLYSVLNK